MTTRSEAPDDSAERLAELLHFTETLARIGIALTAELDLEKLVQRLTDEATALCRARFGAFFYNLVNEQGEVYQLFTLSGAPKEAFERFGLPRATPLFGATFHGKHTVRLDDVRKDPRYGQWGPHHGMPKGHLPVTSYLAVPVISRSGEVLGGLFFGHEQASVFTERDERILTAVAAQAAIAIDNARLYRQARRAEEANARRARFAALQASVAVALSKSEAPGAALQRCAEAVVEHLDAAFARVWTLEGEALELVASAGQYTHLDGAHARVPVGALKIGLIAQEKAPHLTNAVLDDPRVGDRAWAEREGMVSFAGYPLRVGDRVLGVVAMFARKPLEPDTLEALSSVADALAIGIERQRTEAERARLLAATQAAQRQAAEQHRRAELLAEVGAALSSASLDYDTTLRTVARLAVPALADWCLVDIVEPGGAVRRVEVAHADPSLDELAHEVARFAPRRDTLEHPPSRALVTREPVLIERFDEVRSRASLGPAHLEAMVKMGGRSVISVPLLARGDVLGVLTFVASAPQRGRYGRDDLSVAVEIGRRAASAIDNARLFRLAQAERARAEAANQAKDEFLATVSHELRTPLNAMLGWTRLLRTGALPEEKRERALETIERNAYAQVQLIEDVLDVSRIITGKLRVDLKPVEVLRVVEAAIDTVRPAADAKGVALQPSLDPEAGTSLGDPDRLQQVVWNLLTNAVKFTPAGGRVTVGLRRGAGQIEIVVSDTGQGIPADFLPHVFERFRQADGATTRAHGGLGLGLSIVKHLVELHGGSIEAQSEGEGRGSRFEVRLPLASPHAKGLAQTQSAPAVLPSASTFTCPPKLEGLRVLVVDDEPDARELLQSVLESCRAEVSLARSAAEALSLLQASPPDVLVSDIGMPGEDGYALIGKVRALSPEAGGRTPAVALTAYARLEDRTRALLSGFTSHVAKPVEPHELARVIATVAGRAAR